MSEVARPQASEVGVEASAGWFIQFEDIAYSIIEYIPGVGDVYSLARAGFAAGSGDEKRFHLSLLNFVLGAIRDVNLLTGAAEPPVVVVFHAIGENFSKKIYDVLTNPHEQPLNVPVVDEEEYKKGKKPNIILAGETPEERRKARDAMFTGKAKGVHHFYRSIFKGTIIAPVYAEHGRDIWLLLPEGFRDGAPCTFIWKWEEDAHEPPQVDRPDNTHGTIKLSPGNVTTFELENQKGYYHFCGKIRSKKDITVTMQSRGEDINIDMSRQPQMHY